MVKDFLAELLGKEARGEITREQFNEELGAHVAALAGTIQDTTAHFDRAAANHLGLNLSDPFERSQRFEAATMVETARELSIQPLIDERDLCTQKLIIERAYGLAETNPLLAAALFRLVFPNWTLIGRKTG